MKALASTITSLTPALLGDPEQSGRWHTPPVSTLDAEDAREHLP
jgi:hypothetical protein